MEGSVFSATVEKWRGRPRRPRWKPANGETGAAKCGYCTPGRVLTAKVMLDENPAPTRAEIRKAIAGNICRCTGYMQIVDAVELAAATLRGERL